MNKTGRPDKPTPIRLKDFKAPLQQEAMRIDRSLNWLVMSWLKEHPCIKEYIKRKNAKGKKSTN